MCYKLILSESCSNEFVQGKERLNNQAHVISGHCMIQFSLKQSQSNTNMGFREFCFVLFRFKSFVNNDQSASQSFQLTWKCTEGSCPSSEGQGPRRPPAEPGLLAQCSVYPRLMRTDTHYLYLEGKCSNQHQVFLKIPNPRKTDVLCRE